MNLSLSCGDRVPAWLQSSIITVDKSPYFQQGGKTDPLEEWCVVREVLRAIAPSYGVIKPRRGA